MKRILSLIFLLILPSVVARTEQSNPLRFEVTIASGLISSPQNGRLFVMLNPRRQPEPRLTVGNTGTNAPPVLARDINGFAPGRVGVIDNQAAIFPIESLSRLPAGDYFVQAVFDSNTDLKSVNAPGNLYSRAERRRLDPAVGGVVKIELTEKVAPEELPAETEFVKYVKIQSDLLTKFHGRPIYLRAAIVLPRGYASEPSARYPLRVKIGGYGDRFTGVRRMMNEGADFRRAWEAADAPQMILLHLDGDGPYGDSYQVNSAYKFMEDMVT